MDSEGLKLSFSERLPLLPKFDAEKRTALHVQGQKAYAKHYASEGRTYMSSWRDECKSDDREERKNNKPADIDLGTPVLKPRVKDLAIPVSSSKRKQTKTVITVESSDSNNKSKKRVNKSMEVPVRSKKKRVNDSLSNSSRVERLKERRDRKRAKRAVLKPPASDKENDKEDSCQARKRSKKVPAGFALMHGFTATNVGKDRLTVKPPVSIGVFNKGRASAKTKAVKRKTSGKKGHTDGYFSESKFLNNFKRKISPSDGSSSGNTSKSTSHSSEAYKSPKRGQRTASCDASEVGSIAPTSNPVKQPKVPSESIVWDIELDKSLCNDDHSVKQSNIVLDISHRTWAKQLCEGDARQKSICSVALNPLPDDNGGDKSSSIAPSQSASRRMMIPSAKLVPEKETHSKYFQTRHPSPTQVKVDSESLPLLHSDECHNDTNHMSMIEDHVENAPLLTNSFVSNASHDLASGFMQGEIELEQSEYIPTDRYMLEPPADEFDFGEGCAEYPPYDILEDPGTFGKQQDPRGILTQYGFNSALFNDENDDAARHQGLTTFAPIPGEFELWAGYLLGDDSQYNYPDSPAGQEDVEMEYFCDYSQGGDGSIDEESVILGQDQDFESASEGESVAGSSKDLNTPQDHRFSQGRALLLGCVVPEDNDQRKNNRPLLSSAEVDVAKRLRDHWLPQKL